MVGLSTVDCRQGDRRGESDLLAQAELLNGGEVGVAVRSLEVAKQSVATADHRKETSTRRVIVSMIREVRLQGLDAIGQNRDLDLGGTGIAFMTSVLSLEFGLACE